MNKDIIQQVKKTMKQYGAKHAILGIVKWNGDKEIIENAADANYHATDNAFEEEVAYLKKWRGAQMVYAVHAQN